MILIHSIAHICVLFLVSLLLSLVIQCKPAYYVHVCDILYCYSTVMDFTALLGMCTNVRAQFISNNARLLCIVYATYMHLTGQAECLIIAKQWYMLKSASLLYTGVMHVYKLCA